MTPTRPRDLLAIGLVVAVLANLAVRLTYASLPGFPLLGGITLAVLGDRGGHRRPRAPGAHPPGAGHDTRPAADRGARALLLAKASSVAGAVVCGRVARAPRLHRPAGGNDPGRGGSDTAAAAVGLGCALVLVGGALWLEHCCRTPDDPTDTDPPAAP